MFLLRKVYHMVVVTEIKPNLLTACNYSTTHALHYMSAFQHCSCRAYTPKLVQGHAESLYISYYIENIFATKTFQTKLYNKNCCFNFLYWKHHDTVMTTVTHSRFCVAAINCNRISLHSTGALDHRYCSVCASNTLHKNMVNDCKRYNMECFSLRKLQLEILVTERPPYGNFQQQIQNFKMQILFL